MRKLLILGRHLVRKLAHLLAYLILPFRYLGQWLHFCRGCPPCCAFLQNLRPFYRHLSVNLLIGLMIALLLMTVRDIRLSHETEDMGIDWVMKMFRHTAPSQDGPPFVWLNIDEQTYQHWQEPIFTPRDKLLKLLKFAVEGGPLMVIVDVDLSYPINRTGSQLEPADQALYDFLADYQAHCPKSGCPHILLARTFRKSFAENRGDYVVRPSFLETVVAHSPYIHWASTLFDLERDRVLRRWQLWKVLCSGEVPTVVPSMQLLAVALWNNSSQGATQIASELAAMAARSCGIDNSVGPTHLAVSDDLQLSLSQSRLSRRILYTIPWELPAGEAYPSTLQGNRPLLSSLSAYRITEKGPVSNTLLRDSITVIGGSYEDSRDIYGTPLEWMPGALVIINAIHSLLEYGELTPPDWWFMLLTLSVLILIMSLAFTWFSSFFGMLLSGLLIIVIMIPSSFVLFQYGVWLDFAIPLVMVQLNQMAMVYRELCKL